MKFIVAVRQQWVAPKLLNHLPLSSDRTIHDTLRSQFTQDKSKLVKGDRSSSIEP